jgi:hypothetical protein
VIAFFLLLLGTVILDALAHPRSGGVLHLRSATGTWLLLLMATAAFGIALMLSGNYSASAAAALVLVAILTIVSNAKRAMLGEALLFSDLALIGAVFRHPQFYLSALTGLQKVAIMAAAPGVLIVGYILFLPDPAAHLAGMAIVAGCLATLWLSLRLPPWNGLGHVPDHSADVARHGLLPTILLYWCSWRRSVHPPSPQDVLERQPTGDLAIVVQCESFADPAELFSDAALQLPCLAAARAMAWQWGDLQVPGFGAYTMRTEYGVLFGRDEESLGFRRYDPYLTALGEAAHCLPAKIAAGGWRSLFLHPFDMRFYNRGEILSAGGFADLVAEDRFPPLDPRQGRYLPDAVIADTIMQHAATSPPRTMIYAVTIENHGPWKSSIEGTSVTDGYIEIVRHGDAMLGTLIEGLATLGRAATLVFFGDHRPSIKGVTSPFGPRHTPYVIVRLDETGAPVSGANTRADLTPSQLHHLLHDLLHPQANDKATGA